MEFITEIGIRGSALGLQRIANEVVEYAGICEGPHCGEFAVFAGYGDYCYDCV